MRTEYAPIGFLIKTPESDLTTLADVVELTNFISYADYYAIQTPPLTGLALAKQQIENRLQAFVVDGQPLTVTLELDATLDTAAFRAIWAKIVKFEFDDLSSEHQALIAPFRRFVEDHDLSLFWAVRGDQFIYLSLQQPWKLPIL